MNETEVSNLTGLSDIEAEERLKKYGYNEIPGAEKRGFTKIIFDVLKEPMFILLVICGALYLILGEIEEAMLLLSFVFVIMGITIYQEHKTENALEALRDLSSPRALVIRNGERKRIAGKFVVVDDLMILHEGDRIPADAVLLWERNLSIDESLLTGEAIPVIKSASDNYPDIKMERPGGEDSPFVFSGTLVVQGQGVAIVKSTGSETEMGKIGKSLQTIKQEDTLLQKETGNIVKVISIIGLFLCLLVVTIYGLTRGNWIDGFLAGITLAMAILPEEFPVVLTVFLALGAWRMSKKDVLTREARAVETLGAVTVLCVDKTGTLTQNKMSVKTLYAVNIPEESDISPKSGNYLDIDEKTPELPESFHELIEYGILASKKDPFDPMEKELINLGGEKLADTEHLHTAWELIKEYPLSKELLALSHVWKSNENDQYFVAAKGAPEAIADLCHFNKNQIEELLEIIGTIAKKGLRILGVACSKFPVTNLPPEQHDFKFEFLGLLGFADPVRQGVDTALQECYGAGVRVVMITGDYASTAQNIANQIKLNNSEEFITGVELDRISDEELQRRIKRVNIFSRVVPEQKLRIVNAFKKNGDIVAMTGDGVNDAPALKSSHIGIAMGKRGTDVARESAGLVLVNDDFMSIVEAVKMGRRIFDNLRKAMSYILAIHVPIAGLSLLPVVLGLPLLLYPAHIVFLELVIDPSCSVVFEAEEAEADIMKRKPRLTSEHLFGRKNILISILQGISLLIISGVLFLYSFDFYQNQGLSEIMAENMARTITFVSLISGNIGLIMTNRSWVKTIPETLKIKNSALGMVSVGAMFFLLLINYVPFLRRLFHFEMLGFSLLLGSLAIGFVSVLWFEIYKLVKRTEFS